jgi:serine/threonine-protein kinase
MAAAPDPAALESARRLEQGGRAEEAARAYVQAGAIADGVRVMRGCGRLDAAARMLSDAGLLLEAAECHVEAGDAAAALERLLRVAPRDSRYREAARIAVRLACQLDTLGVRFEQFVGSFIGAGAEADADLPVLYDLGELYLRHGMPENAEEVFEKVVARGPDYRDVEQRLAGLRQDSPALDGTLAHVFAEDERFRRAARRSGASARPASDAPPPAGSPANPTRRLESSDLDAPPSPSPTFGAGTTVADRYRIEAEIGRGGMATVYRARDLELSEDVALKVFRPAPDDEEGLARFRQELKVSRRLVHPNVTRLYDIGNDRGHRYISMELLVGHSVEELIGSAWPLRRGLDCLIQVCAGLAAAHAEGVIHRDIKPGNIFLTREGLAKIMDFGIARQRAAPGVTQAGMIVGTPEYLSPEQIAGGAAAETSDLYALGVVAYEMFTGKKPFVHDELLRLLQMHLVMPPEPPSRHRPGLPDALEKAILTLLRKDPQERFPSARAAGTALVAVTSSLRG